MVLAPQQDTPGSRFLRDYEAMDASPAPEPAGGSTPGTRFMEQWLARDLPMPQRTAGQAFREAFKVENVPFVGGVATAKGLWDLGDSITAYADGSATAAQKGRVLETLLRGQQDASVGAMAMDIVGQMPSFMVELLATGGLAAVGKKAAKEVGEKMLSKGLREVAERVLEKKVVGSVARFAGKFGDELATSAFQAVTMPTGLLASTAQVQLPELKLSVDEAGDLAVKLQSTSQDFLEAMPEGFMRAWIETASERSGAFMPRRLAQMQGRVLGGLAKKEGKSVALETLNKLGWHGVLQEMGEEQVSAALRAALLDDPWEMPSPEELLAQALAFSVPGLAGRAAEKGMGAVVEHVAGEQVKQAAAEVASVEAKREGVRRAPQEAPARRSSPESVQAAVARFGAAQAVPEKAPAEGEKAAEPAPAVVLEEVQPESPGSLFAAGVADKLGVDVVFVQSADGKPLQRTGVATVTAEGVPLVIVDANASEADATRAILNHEMAHHLTDAVGLETLWGRLVSVAPDLAQAAESRARVLDPSLEGEALQSESIAIMTENIGEVLDLGMRSEEALTRLMSDPTLGERILEYVAAAMRAVGLDVDGVRTRVLQKLQIKHASATDALGRSVPLDTAAVAAKAVLDSLAEIEGKAETGTGQEAPTADPAVGAKGEAPGPATQTEGVPDGDAQEADVAQEEARREEGGVQEEGLDAQAAEAALTPKQAKRARQKAGKAEARARREKAKDDAVQEAAAAAEAEALAERDTRSRARLKAEIALKEQTILRAAAEPEGLQGVSGETFIEYQKLLREAEAEITAEDTAERVAPARIEREVAAQEGQVGADRPRRPERETAAEFAARESEDRFRTRKDEGPIETAAREQAYRQLFRRGKAPAWLAKFFDYDTLRKGIVDDIWPIEKEFLSDIAAGSPEAVNSLINLRLSRSKAIFNMERAAKNFQAIGDVFKTAEEIEEAGLYDMARHARRANQVIQETRDQSNTAGSGLTNTEADAIIERHKDDPRFEKAYQMLRKEIEHTLDEKVRYGLVSQAWADANRELWGDTFVPLKGFADAADEKRLDGAFPNRPRLWVTNNERRRKGRKEGQLAANPIQEAFKSATRTAMVGEYNLAMRGILEFAEAHPDVATVIQVPPSAEMLEALESGSLEDMVAAEAAMPNAIDWAIREGLVPRGTNATDLPRAMVGGEKVYVTFHNEEVTETLAKYGQVDLSAFDKSVGKITRWVAKTNTQWAPTFFVSNLARDLQAGHNYVKAFHGKEGAALFRGNLRGALRAAIALNRDGEASEGWEEALRVYTEEGGRLSVAGLDMKSEIAYLQKILVKPERGRAKAAVVGVLDAVEKVSRTSEDLTRLASLKTALDLGASVGEAAMFARKATTDFSRRGTWTASVGAFYAFANASVQGVGQLLQILSTPQGKRTLRNVVLAGFAWDQMMALLSDDDEDGRLMWDTIPGYTRDDNLTITAGGDAAAKIPLPHGVRALWGAGAGLSRLVRGVTSTSEFAWGAAGGLIRDANPIGGDTLAGAITPTALDTASEIWANKDWRGEPISPQDFGQGGPDSERAFSSVNPAAEYIARKLSRLTGGDESQGGFIDITPGTIEHLAEGAAGGAGKDFLLTITSAYDALTGKVPDVKRVPVLRRLVSHEPKRRVRRLYELRVQAKELSTRIRLYEDSGNTDAARNLKEDNRELLRARKKLNAAASEYRELRDAGDEDAALDVASKAIRDLGHIR